MVEKRRLARPGGVLDPLLASNGIPAFAGIHRIVDFKIIEAWVTWDNLTGPTQLGLYSPSSEEAAEDG